MQGVIVIPIIFGTNSRVQAKCRLLLCDRTWTVAEQAHQLAWKRPQWVSSGSSGQ